MTNSPFSHFIEGHLSLYEWISQHSANGYIEEDQQGELPDIESKSLSWEILEGINVAPGFFEGVIGSEGEEAQSKAQILFELFTGFEYENDTNEQLDQKLGAIYGFMLENSTITYTDSFFDLLTERKDEVSLGLIYKISKMFLTEASHREPVKWAIAFIGLLNMSEEDIELVALFGLSEEFTKFVAVALYRHDQNELIFELAKKVHGWGRVTYLQYLEPAHASIRQWLLLEGYKCSLGTNHTAYECLLKGNLLDYIQTYGWDDELYTSVGDLLLGMIDDGPGNAIADYEDAKEVIKAFIEEGQTRCRTLEQFWILVKLFHYLGDHGQNDGWEEEERTATRKRIGDLGLRSGIDWKSMAYEDIRNFKNRDILKVFSVNVWEELFALAVEDEVFDDWYVLSETKNIDQYKRLCVLAENRFELDHIASGPKDELGLGSEFGQHIDLTIIVQNLRNFDEIIGEELVAAALQSPVTNNRNMALNVIQTYERIPEMFINIIQKNLEIDPNENVKERYAKILRLHGLKSSMTLYKGTIRYGSSWDEKLIPYLNGHALANRAVLEEYIYPDPRNYYWCDDFSPDTYIALAKAGFISVSHRVNGDLVLLPEIQEEYAVLDFRDLHISHKVAKLIKKGGYRLEFNTSFNDVLSSIQTAYEDCWMVGEYAQLMEILSHNTYTDFRLFSTELIDESTGGLISGEIGYTTRNVYTSLSGFHNPDKKYENWGTLQLVLLGHHLESEGVHFWNLGHPHMEYKIDLGAKIVRRNNFLNK